jgi:acyl dehydratase
MPHVGESFFRRYVFTRADIADFAERCGDDNPLHQDGLAASRSRFGGIIASGPHAAAVHMAVLASHYSPAYEMVGLEFNVRFVKAIPADTATTLSWAVVAVDPNDKLGGDVVVLDGKIEDGSGRVFVAGTGRIVVWPRPAHSSLQSGRD